MAKAPVPGRVKTRLCPPATPHQAAELAAAALADTVAAARRVPAARVVVALDGDLADAVDGPGLQAVLRTTTVVAQRGDGLGARIAAAHADVARLAPDACTVQIGMDTPHVDPTVLDGCLRTLARPGGPGAALGLATDGGWWALGLRDPRHAALVGPVPMSQTDTGARTRDALVAAGLRVVPLPELTDVDTMPDAYAVAAACPAGRFAAALRAATVVA